MSKLIIIGAGLSGLSAAITAARQGKKCALVSTQPSERSQSVLAEGGINAALNTKGENDSVQEHFQDTMRSGGFLADPNAVKGLTDAAPEMIEMLRNLGVPFNLKNSVPELRSMGGQKKKRTAFSKSSTGKILMTALIDEVRKYEACGLVKRLSHHAFIELSLFQEQCCGCFVRDTYTGEILSLKGPVLLASGGLNGMFDGHTTGTVQNTGAVTAAVFRQGVKLANLEFIQYHPTTVSIPGKRCLISEAARGEGGRLFVRRNGSPWYFMEEKYPALGNLMSRDIVSREMISVCSEKDCESQVYLDMAGIPKDIWESRLSDLRAECIHYLNISPDREPVPVAPGIHYFMGGVLVNAEHRASIKHLYAAGECACQYHGANRLGGNSMLGAIHGGMTAAKYAMAYWKEDSVNCKEPPPVSRRPIGYDGKKLSAILINGLGIVRTEQQLAEAVQMASALQRQESLSGYENDRLLLGLVMLRSALSRRESRGAHYREDYPNTNDLYQKTTTASFDGAHIHIKFQEIPKFKEGQDEKDNQNSAAYQSPKSALLAELSL